MIISRTEVQRLNIKISRRKANKIFIEKKKKKELKQR